MLQGNSVGRREEFETGTLTQVFANPTGKRQKVGGTTFDWSTVAPLAAEVNLPDGTKVKVGTRYLRYGTFIARINAAGPSLGYYGIYDAAANDGRQLRVRDSIFFVNQNIFFEDRLSAHVTAYYGGTVVEARMCLMEPGAGGIITPGYMTIAQVRETFPLLNFVSTNR